VTVDASPKLAQPRSDRVPLGIVYMLGATIMFAISNALSKWQVAAYSFDEVLFFRVLASLVTVAIIVLPRTGVSAFHTRRLSAHFSRSVMQAAGQSCLMIAFGLMPLGGAIAINFSAPLFATLLAAVLLKERVGAARGAALLVGFFGVLLVAAPGADTFRLGALFAIANAVLYGSVTTAVRGLASTESPATLTIYQMLFMTAIFALGLPLFGFVWPSNGDLVALLVNGVFNAIGQYWWTRALALAPPAAIGPFYYFSLVWALILGFAFWNEIPTPPLIAGSAIVVASGLFLLWHESRGRSRRPRAAIPQIEGD
jgi:drug/metabolite transporter (DMT)-like permease